MSIELNYMPKLEISTNVACRVKCDFCPQELHIEQYSSKNKLENISYGKPEQMSFDTFTKCLSTIPKSVMISFAGYSEPWLNPDCSKMIIHAYEKGHEIEVFSTLVGMKLEDIELIKYVKFRTFHLHLPDNQNFAKISVNQNYLNLLKQLLLDIPNVTGMSMGDLHPKIKLASNTDLTPDVMINRANNVEIVKPNERQSGPLVCNRASKLDLVDIVDDNVLLPNGDVSLCHMDYGLQHILGNLLVLRYDSIFKSSEYMEFHKKQKSFDSNVLCRFCPEAIPQTELTHKQNLESNRDNNFNSKVTADITKLFKDTLNRLPDEEGFNYFYNQLITDQLMLSDVKKMIEKSSEYLSLHPLKLN
jgi:hypothetical protein